MTQATSKVRKWVKALTYRFLSLGVSTTIGFVMTGSLAAALSFGAIDGVFKMGVYYAHETAWERITKAGIIGATLAALIGLARLAANTDAAEAGRAPAFA